MLSATLAHAQSMLFNYDNGGNRTSRTIVVNRAKSMTSEFRDIVLDTTIKFHYDNVQQALTIEISSTEGFLTIYNRLGEIVLSKDIDYGMNKVTTSNLQKGIYIFHVKANYKESVYKVYIK